MTEVQNVVILTKLFEQPKTKLDIIYKKILFINKIYVILLFYAQPNTNDMRNIKIAQYLHKSVTKSSFS